MPLATLSIDVIARLGQLKSDMDRAGAVVESSTSRMKSSFTAVASAAKLLAVGVTAAFAAGGAIVGFVKQVDAGLIAIKDLSEATGASIENISRLENVARNAGGGIDDFSKLLIKFNSALKDAERTKELGAAFKAIGLDVEALRRLDPAEALYEVAFAFNKYRDDGNKARLMQELFGKSIKEAGPFLKELVEQGRVNATVTRDQVEEADKFNKELAKLKTRAEDAARGITAALVPALNRLADRIRQKGILSGLFGRDETQEAINASFAISDRIRVVTDQIINWTAIAEEAEGKDSRRAIVAKNKIKDYREELKRLQEQLTKTNDLLKEAGGADTSNFSNEGRNAANSKPSVPTPTTTKKAPASRQLSELPLDQATVDAMRALEQTDSAKILALNAAIDKLFELQTSGVGGDNLEIVQAITTLREELKKLDPAAQEAAKNQALLEGLLSGTKARKAAEDYKALQLAIAAIGKETDPQRIKELGQLIDILTGMPQEVSVQVEDATGKLTEFAQQAAANIQDALGTTLRRTLKGDFDSIGQLWVDMLQEMAIQAATAKLNEWLFGDFLKGGSLGEGGTAILEFFKSFAGPRALGGPVPAGQWAIAGEAGPEVVLGPATVLPNGASAGQSTYAPTIVVQGDVGPATVSLVERLIARERVRFQRSQYARGLA